MKNLLNLMLVKEKKNNELGIDYSNYNCHSFYLDDYSSKKKY